MRVQRRFLLLRDRLRPWIRRVPKESQMKMNLLPDHSAAVKWRAVAGHGL